ncbi:MAG: hypothetical protein ABI488_25210 [Polyangiaceae bacterium]
MTKFVSLFSGSLLLVLSAASCSAADPITNHFTCKDVCQSYADCFDDSYNVDDCKSKCEDKASSSDHQQDKLDECHACIDDKSCVADVASCSGSCSAFVP